MGPFQLQSVSQVLWANTRVVLRSPVIVFWDYWTCSEDTLKMLWSHFLSLRGPMKHHLNLFEILTNVFMTLTMTLCFTVSVLNLILILRPFLFENIFFWETTWMRNNFIFQQRKSWLLYISFILCLKTQHFLLKLISLLSYLIILNLEPAKGNYLVLSQSAWKSD